MARRLTSSDWEAVFGSSSLRRISESKPCVMMVGGGRVEEMDGSRWSRRRRDQSVNDQIMGLSNKSLQRREMSGNGDVLQATPTAFEEVGGVTAFNQCNFSSIVKSSDHKVSQKDSTTVLK